MTLVIYCVKSLLRIRPEGALRHHFALGARRAPCAECTARSSPRVDVPYN
jgi:hypothetical protein